VGLGCVWARKGRDGSGGIETGHPRPMN
jgi:hypothetical protein